MINREWLHCKSGRLQRVACSLALASLLISTANLAFAISDSAGTAGGAFMKLGQGSARAMALGKSYVALAEGPDALTWNPAGLGVTQQKELTYSYLRYVDGLSSPFFMGYAHPMGRTVWGGNAAYLASDDFDARDAAGVPQQADVHVRDGFGTLGAARSFWYEKFFAGASLKLIHEDNNGNLHDTIAADMGFLLKPANLWSLGFAVQNIAGGKANAATVLRGGAAYKLGDFLTLALELNDSSDTGARVGLGGECLVPEEYLELGQLTFRVGYYSADTLGQNRTSSQIKTLHLDKTSGLSFGFGLFTSQAFGYGIGLDYAFVPYGALGSGDQI